MLESLDISKILISTANFHSHLAAHLSWIAAVFPSSGERIWIAHPPAKLNLFFEVLAKRADGYHEIESVMVPISLCDTLVLEFPAPHGQAAPIALTCEWQLPRVDEQEVDIHLRVPLAPPVITVVGASQSSQLKPILSTGIASGTPEIPSLPTDNRNLVWRAIELVRRRCGISAPVRAHLVKRIPAQAGLGGGSSDAAATLVLLNRAWKLGLKREKLTELAAELGSDVPFFLSGGPAISSGRGEKTVPLPGHFQLYWIVVKPPVGLSTAAVYTHCRPAARPRSATDMLAALRTAGPAGIGSNLHNALQGAARELTPWIERVTAELHRAGCLAQQMSGSGSSCFGLARSARHAGMIARRLRSRRIGQVWAAHS